MVYTKRRLTIELIVQLLAAGIAGLLAYRGIFSTQENGQLLAAIVGIVMLLFVQALYAIRNAFITRVRIRNRYGVELSMNEDAFLRRSEERGWAKRANEHFPQGLVITDSDESNWALRNWEGRQELARA